MRGWWWLAVPCCGIAGATLSIAGAQVFAPDLDVDAGWLIIEIGAMIGLATGVWVVLRRRRRAARATTTRGSQLS
jgi:hypothetical protein